jgi:hypothetical protein
VLSSNREPVISTNAGNTCYITTIIEEHFKVKYLYYFSKHTFIIQGQRCSCKCSELWQKPWTITVVECFSYETGSSIKLPLLTFSNINVKLLNSRTYLLKTGQTHLAGTNLTYPKEVLAKKYYFWIWFQIDAKICQSILDVADQNPGRRSKVDYIKPFRPKFSVIT